MKRDFRIIVLIGLFGIIGLLPPLRAEVPIVKPDLSKPTGIAPAYFGPNALPIIDMSDGLTQRDLSVELAGEGYFGYQQHNNTADIFARVRVPLFTRWANLSVWMPVFGWYDQYDGKGSGAGDVYISTDIQVLHNEWFKTEKAKYIPQMTVRVGVKTASGESSLNGVVTLTTRVTSLTLPSDNPFLSVLSACVLPVRPDSSAGRPITRVRTMP